MLAGHILILTFLGLMFIPNHHPGCLVQLIAMVSPLEVVIVVSIQAIFRPVSHSHGSAIEPNTLGKNHMLLPPRRNHRRRHQGRQRIGLALGVGPGAFGAGAENATSRPENPVRRPPAGARGELQASSGSLALTEAVAFYGLLG